MARFNTHCKENAALSPGKTVNEFWLRKMCACKQDTACTWILSGESGTSTILWKRAGLLPILEEWKNRLHAKAKTWRVPAYAGPVMFSAGGTAA